MMRSQKRNNLFVMILTYTLLSAFALVMLFPFLYMIFTSLKIPSDTFRYPPRILPRDPTTIRAEGFDEPLPLFYIIHEGQTKQFALARSNIKIGSFVDPNDPAVTAEAKISDVKPAGGFTNPKTAIYNGEEVKLYEIEVEGRIFEMVQTSQTTVGRFIDPANPDVFIEQNVRTSTPVETIRFHPENYQNVLQLRKMDRSLSNTILITILVVIGQLLTSVLGGYAFARLNFPGRDSLFLMYLATIMIPFVMLIVPLYQLMVAIGWVDKMASLVLPWIFSAYGTFLMRQFFITIPRDVEEAALMDGASRLRILWTIFIPASVPALATQATFTFLYAWNSFFWPLVVINTGNEQNHVLTLSLNVLRGRASDTPNLILAGAAIAILPPFLVFILGQRFFIESAAGSGGKEG